MRIAMMRWHRRLFRRPDGSRRCTFIARGRYLDAIRHNGLKINSAELGDAVILLAIDNPADVGPVDCVIMGVKLWDTEETGRAIAPMLRPDTIVLSCRTASTEMTYWNPSWAGNG